MIPRPALRRRQAGFTLIEVMVAIALMAVVSIISWRGLSHVSDMQQRLAGDAGDVENLVRLLGQLERDVSLRAPDTVTAEASPTTAVETLPQSLRITFDDTPAHSARLEIVRSDGADPGAWQRVAWFLDNGVLRRAAGAAARRYPLPAAGAGAAVLAGVTRFAIRAWLPGQGWIAPPFPTSGAAFAGLEIAAERATPAGIERYRRVVVLQ